MQVDLSIDEMDVEVLRKCFQQRLEEHIIHLMEHCGCRTTAQIPVRSNLSLDIMISKVSQVGVETKIFPLPE